VTTDSQVNGRHTADSDQPEQPVALDPLQYRAWDSLVSECSGSSFFHRTAWARVLQETYGHRPIYFCRFADGQLEGLLPIMEVSSPWTGRRGVSLPFSDFCSPLSVEGARRRELYELALEHGRGRGWSYLECRNSDPEWPGATPSLAFYGHVIDLTCGQEALFECLDSAVRRGIRKGEGAGLNVEFSSSLDSIQTFYALHCRTRHRHGLPPQPFRFFENIARYVLAPGHGFVATVRLAKKPLAASVFFQHRMEVLYKFGASDYAFQDLRPNNLMMWAAIKRCAANGFARLHLGRTSLANEGLRRFKLGFGAREERIEYCKYDFGKRTFVRDVDRAEGWVNHVFRCLPGPVLRLAGRVIYPHLS